MNTQEFDKETEKVWELRLSDIQSAYTKALDLLEQSERQDYKKGIADCCKILGYCFWRFSDYSLSLSHSLRGIDIYQKIGDIDGEANILNNIGAVYMFQNDNEKRLEVNLRCQELRRQIGDLEAISSSEGNIGETYFEMGNYKNAMTCFKNVLADSNSSPQGQSWAYHNIGKIKQVEKNYSLALDFYRKGLELSESISYNVLVWESYLIITELFLEQEDFDSAIQHAEKALEVSIRIGAKEGEKKALYLLSKIYELKGEFQTSLKYHKDFHSKDMEISRDTEIERLKTAQLKAAYDKIEETKNELVDSIRYAERIQNAVLTRDQKQELIADNFVFYQPKDIVSGDFYWYFEREDQFYICVADCTGHGVPGAFLTMLGTTFLNEIVNLHLDVTPAFILDKLRHHLIQALSKKSEVGTKDGMDISLMRFHTKTKLAEWAGAFNPLWVVRENGNTLKASGNILSHPFDKHTLFELKGDKIPVANTENLKPFSNHHIQLYSGDRIYMFSDGFSDQFGGDLGKKYRSKKLKETLINMQHLPTEKQGDFLQTEFQNWKRNLEQVDDVCVLGFDIH